jgi:uncharacterized protein involved in cysteine biosynthesis
MIMSDVIEQAILAQAQQNHELLEKVYRSTEKTRKMFVWTLVLTLIAFVLPMLGLMFAVPYFLSTYLPALTGV